eukprot:862071-Rhodomonas_salina.1
MVRMEAMCTSSARHTQHSSAASSLSHTALPPLVNTLSRPHAGINGGVAGIDRGAAGINGGAAGIE